MTSSQNRVKILLYSMTILLAYLLEDAAFPPLNTLYNPLILPVAITAIGIAAGHGTGTVFGLAAGLLWALGTDFNMYGAWRIIAFTLTGLFAGLMTGAYFLNNLKTCLLLSIPALFLSDGLFVIFRSFAGSLPPSAFFTLFLPQAAISLIFCLIFYPLASYISRIGGFHG